MLFYKPGPGDQKCSSGFLFFLLALRFRMLAHNPIFEEKNQRECQKYH